MSIFLQLGENNEVLVEHGHFVLSVLQWLDPAEDPHIAFQMRDLLLLNLSDKFILVQVRLHVLEAALHHLDLALQLIVLLLVLLVEQLHLFVQFLLHHLLELLLHLLYLA